MRSIRQPIMGDRRRSIVVAGAVIAVLLCSDARAQSGAPERWVGTWTTAEVGRPQNPVPPLPPLQPFMVNTQVSCAGGAARRLAAAGPDLRALRRTCTSRIRRCVKSCTPASVDSKARVVLSNAYGTAAVTIGGAHIALRDKEAAIQAPGHPLTFSGKPTITIPANAVMYSDPVNADCAPDGRSRHRSLSARHDEHAGAR